jgi:outer membrane protein OmpA-like peptidoglycan-associated protein
MNSRRSLAPNTTLHREDRTAARSQIHTDEEATKYDDHTAHVRILMDSGYFKMYANEKRLYNIPELLFRRDSVIRLALVGAADNEALFITSIRVAESETDVLYDALLKKGRWATQGILFATGKAELQPESRPVLKEIASTMKKHGDLKILIEGHTDNVGGSASNLSLSDARGGGQSDARVRTLVSAARITTKGFGDTEAVGAEHHGRGARAEPPRRDRETMMKTTGVGAGACASARQQPRRRAVRSTQSSAPRFSRAMRSSVARSSRAICRG